MKLDDPEYWSKQYGHKITQEEADEIKRNLVGFTECLIDVYENLKKNGRVDKDGNILPKKPGSELSSREAS